MKEEQVSIDLPYSLPMAAPTYGRPPYAYRRCPQLIVVFRSTTAAIRALVPEPLVPNGDDLAFLMIGTMRTDEFGDYNESIVAVPAALGDRVGNHVVFHHVEADDPMVAGREIYGWPKRFAEIRWSEAAGRVTATATRGGVALVRATADLEGPARPEDLALSPTWLNLKVIPSVGDGAPPDVAQITSMTLLDLKVDGAHRGPATLEFSSTAADPVGRLEVHDVLGAIHARLSFDLPAGEVVHDYLATTGRQAPQVAAVSG
jgi:acetoacetate decarboxylase